LGFDDVEFATLRYVDWLNNRRLHGEITDDDGYTTPAEFEATYYCQNQPGLEPVTNNPGRHQPWALQLLEQLSSAGSICVP
jgi:hypothetical protein